MSQDAYLRFIGAGVREALASHYRVNGSDFGYRLARRFMFEVAAEVAEAHSTEDAVELLYRVGDRVSAGMPLGVPMLPGEELMPGPKAALAKQEAAPEPEPDEGPWMDFDFETNSIAIGGLTAAEALQRLRTATQHMQIALEAELTPWRRVIRRTWRETPKWFVGFLIGLVAAGLTR